MNEMTTCETCGGWFTWDELAETIEERLCEYCSSGIGRADEEIEHDYDGEW